ncbi:hypothetical protein ILUMI_23441 [Ignelater luminosus]|uniref:Peptidase S1 domain-containing protein n=1 Tax=Ignelater luminosus TaxID=2038154 RepID=A0A8K0CDU9_IGNLU|nr:hypothetical protein ILUMI_23441 [Ignelater luminosus]
MKGRTESNEEGYKIDRKRLNIITLRHYKIKALGSNEIENKDNEREDELAKSACQPEPREIIPIAKTEVKRQVWAETKVPWRLDWQESSRAMYMIKKIMHTGKYILLVVTLEGYIRLHHASSDSFYMMMEAFLNEELFIANYLAKERKGELELTKKETKLLDGPQTKGKGYRPEGGFFVKSPVPRGEIVWSCRFVLGTTSAKVPTATELVRGIALMFLEVRLVGFKLENEERIVNGTDAKACEIKYIVSLRKNRSHRCGASILDSTHVLTAAHCVHRQLSLSLSIQYGVTTISSNRVNSIGVRRIYIHRKYSPLRSYANDIAVLKLRSAIPLGECIQPVKLPLQGEIPPAGKSAVLSGWGLSKTGGIVMKNLQRVDIFVYNDEDCRKAHGSRVNPNYHVCAGVPEGGKGQCSGDSGGPLVVDDVQYGIVSWSVKPCAREGYPGVFTRVPNYIDWINDKKKL